MTLAKDIKGSQDMSPFQDYKHLTATTYHVVATYVVLWKEKSFFIMQNVHSLFIYGMQQWIATKRPHLVKDKNGTIIEADWRVLHQEIGKVRGRGRGRGRGTPHPHLNFSPIAITNTKWLFSLNAQCRQSGDSRFPNTGFSDRRLEQKHPPHHFPIIHSGEL